MSSFRIIPIKPVSELQEEALSAEPPSEDGEYRRPELVDLARLDPKMRFDIRYATSDNFMGTVFYASARAFLQRPAAEAVLQVSKELSGGGYGLVVYDAYRPWYVTKMFWDATPDSLKRFVAPPASGSRHNRGAAIDVGLYDLASGALLPMPSGYDEFTERAHADYAAGSSDSLRNRDLLREAMERHGFVNYSCEWWHFDHEDWREYPIMNLSFEEIDAG